MPAPASDPLASPLRRKLHGLVSLYPGLHLRELARRAELEPNHAKYHLLYLQRRELVSSRRLDGYWRFWPRATGATGLQEEVAPEHKEVLRHLRRPVPARVCRLLLERQEMAHHELRAHLDLAHSTVHHHMQRMVATGLVMTERCGRERRYRLQNAQLVAQAIQLYPDPGQGEAAAAAPVTVAPDAATVVPSAPSDGPAAGQDAARRLDTLERPPRPVRRRWDGADDADEADDARDAGPSQAPADDAVEPTGPATADAAPDDPAPPA